MDINFCPHCGQDLAPKPAPTEEKQVIRREVTTAEKDRLWGLLHLPVDLVPIGVLVDASASPIALVLDDKEKRLWAGAHGEVKMLGDFGVPDMPAPPVPGNGHPATVPSHLCNTSSKSESERRGRERYGR